MKQWSVSTHPTDPWRVSYYRSGKMARDYESSNAINIELAKNFNGSGATAFGGARSWPSVSMHIGFCERDYAKRDEFVEKLKKFIDDNLP